MPSIFTRKRPSTKKGTKQSGGFCSGQPMMLRALGIMAGGSRRRNGHMREGEAAAGRRNGHMREGEAAAGLCASDHRNGQCKPGAYKPTRKNLGRLRRHLAGKSIGFTQRSSLKAKGLLRRANGSCKVSKKYQ
jgi:hypothetical protein